MFPLLNINPNKILFLKKKTDEKNFTKYFTPRKLIYFVCYELTFPTYTGK